MTRRLRSEGQPRGPRRAWHSIGPEKLAHPWTDGSEPSQGRDSVTATSVSMCGRVFLLPGFPTAGGPALTGNEPPVPGSIQADPGTQHNAGPTPPSCWSQKQSQKSKPLSLCPTLTPARRPPSTQLHGLWTTPAPGAPSSRPVRTLQPKPAGCGLDGQAASSVQLLPDVFSEPLDRSNHSANPPSRDSNTDLNRRPRGSLADVVVGEAWRLVRRTGLPSLGLRAKPCREKGQDSDSVQQRVRPGVQVPSSSYR